ncbi:hypothetical protein OROGR_024674 [Orobanche gracilis]
MGVNQSERAEPDRMLVQTCLKFYRASNTIFELDLISNWVELGLAPIEPNKNRVRDFQSLTTNFGASAAHH